MPPRGRRGKTVVFSRDYRLRWPSRPGRRPSSISKARLSAVLFCTANLCRARYQYPPCRNGIRQLHCCSSLEPSGRIPRRFNSCSGYALVVTAPTARLALDSPLEEAGFELVWGFSCQVVVLVFCRFFVRSGKAVLRPVACGQVRVARGRGQGALSRQ